MTQQLNPNFAGKNIAVFGAAGFIGSKVVARLLELGAKPIALVHTARQVRQLEEFLGGENVVPTFIRDVSGDSEDFYTGDSEDFYTFDGFLENRDDCEEDFKLDGVVYCVGHCLPGGFREEVKRSLSHIDADSDFLQEEFDRHVFGAQNVYRKCLPWVRWGGSFTFMSSAATRLLSMPLEKRPPHIQIYGHLAAISALDALIEGWRMDPQTHEERILIHSVKPPAISDSPFHQYEGAQKMPVSVTSGEVVQAIIECIMADSHQTRMMVKPPPAQQLQSEMPAPVAGQTSA